MNPVIPWARCRVRERPFNSAGWAALTMWLVLVMAGVVR